MVYARSRKNTTRLSSVRARRNRSIFTPRSLAEAGPEPAPVEDQVRDGPHRKDGVDDEEPSVHAPAARGDLALRVLVDLVLVSHCPSLNLGAPQLRTPKPPPREARRASRPRRCGTRRWP